jgi:hypothetical protein
MKFFFALPFLVAVSAFAGDALRRWMRQRQH